MHQLRRFVGDNPQPWALDADDLVGWLAARRWAPETRRSYRAALRQFYAWGVRAGRLERSPAEELPPVPAPVTVARPAPAEAVAEGLAASDPRVRLMVALGARCGLRRAEIAQVHADDVERDLVGWSLVVHGKGRRERRVPLPDDLAFQLRRADGWVFPGLDAGHLSPPRVGELVAAALPGDWTAHTLRHYFASRTYRACRDPFIVQRLLGHAKLDTTLRYVQLGDDAVRGAVSWAA